MCFKKREPDFIQFDGDNSQLLTKKNVGNTLAAGAVVICPPTHTALIMRNGAFANECCGGECPLYENSSKNARKAVRTLEVIFISKTAKLTVKWGTPLQRRIEYVDPILQKPVSIGAFGSMDIRVVDPKKFYLEMVAGFGNGYSVEDLQDRIRSRVVSDTIKAISDVFRNDNLSFVDYSVAQNDIQDKVKDELSDKYVEYFGFAVCDFIIENINITDEQEAEIKKIYAQDSSFERGKVMFERRREMTGLEQEAALQDAEFNSKLRQYDYASEDRARRIDQEQQDRDWRRADVVSERIERMHRYEIDAQRDIEVARSTAASKVASAAVTAATASHAGTTARHCALCGAPYDTSDMYCKSCGAPIPRNDKTRKCSGCNSEVPWGTAYCPICGKKM